MVKRLHGFTMAAGRSYNTTESQEVIRVDFYNPDTISDE